MNSHLARLRRRLDDGSAAVGQVGLGYVGLPVACLIASTGLEVIGVDLKQDRVNLINAGRSPIEGEEPGLGELIAEVVSAKRLHAATQVAELARADMILIAVETPVDDSDHRPRFAALRAACAQIGQNMAPGVLVIVESTISPGTIDSIVVPALEAASGLRAGSDFFIGHCPERVMPGRLLSNLRELSRVVGGQTPEVAETMALLYRRYVRGDLDLTDPLTAELVKTAENAYRDVNIAFANQLALICEGAGGDVWKVRELVNKSPGRNVLLPGAGVGGHCIPKDPWLLASAVPDSETPLLRAARSINEGMPAHVAELTERVLGEVGVPVIDARVAVLGYSYLENSDDTRHSPTATFLSHLEARGIASTVHDPYVADFARPLEEVLEGTDVLVLMVAHSQYRGLDLVRVASLMRHRGLVDARGVFLRDAVTAAGFVSRRIGVGNRPRLIEETPV